MTSVVRQQGLQGTCLQKPALPPGICPLPSQCSMCLVKRRLSKCTESFMLG